MSAEEYYCVLSGLSSQSIGEDEGDDFADLPNGWLKITIQRRYENPKWQLIQQIKEASLAQMMEQIPAEQHEEVLEALQLQIDAQYVALEEKLGRYVVAEEVRYISDPSLSEAVSEEATSLLGKLELSLSDFDISDDSDDEKDVDNSEE